MMASPDDPGPSGEFAAGPGRSRPTHVAAVMSTVEGARLWCYLAGCLVFSAGAYLFISAQLGTDPLDVFALGLQEYVPITIGLAQAGVAALCLAAVAAWTRSRPVLSPLLTFFLCGSVIDLLLLVDAQRVVPLPPYPMLGAATLLCAYGSALIVASGFGIRAMDLLAIVMVVRWRWPFFVAKGALEMLLLGTGWLLGGPVGVGTVCFLIGVALLIQPLLRANMRMHIHNHGLPTRGDARLAS